MTEHATEHRAAKIPRRVHPLDASWHGTLSGYTNHCCRCPRCKKVASERNRAYRMSKKPTTGAEAPAPGTILAPTEDTKNDA